MKPSKSADDWLAEHGEIYQNELIGSICASEIFFGMDSMIGLMPSLPVGNRFGRG